MPDTRPKIWNEIVKKDSSVFYTEAKTSLENHVIHTAYFLGLNEALLCYDYSIYEPEKEGGYTYLEVVKVRVTDIGDFIKDNPFIYSRLTELHKRAYLAVIEAVTDRIIETKPELYLAFQSSTETSLKAFINNKRKK